MKAGVIWASLSVAGNIDESTVLLKVLHIKYAKISEFCLNIFVGISASGDDLVVSRLHISFETSSLVTWEKVNIELFLYLSNIVKTLRWFQYFMTPLKVGSLTSFANRWLCM